MRSGRSLSPPPRRGGCPGIEPAGKTLIASAGSELRANQPRRHAQRSGLLGPVRRATIVAMTDQALLGRITSNRDIFGGKPIVRGMRISVEMIVNLLAQGETAESILADYPALEPDDIRACLAYAHAVLAEDSLDAVKLAK